MTEGPESDYVIVGGGSAGCVLAARLSEDPSVTVTLLEAGPEDRHPWIHIPAGYARLFLSGRFDWKYETEPDPELNGRRIKWPRGKVLGGSGSINGLVFLRGSPRDYDRWAQAGARGWSYEACLPAFKAIETWEGPPSELHGTAGPIRNGPTRDLSPAGSAFLAACRAAGQPACPDFNGAWYEGAAPNPLNVSGGRRISSARAYLGPARSRPNLRVLTGVRAHRVAIEAGRARAVEGRGPGGGARWTARREVILAAGTIESPKLLMHSGIGDAARLAAFGIAPRLHAPGVGQNLQDHLVVRMPFRTRPCGTMNEHTASWLGYLRMGARWAFARRGPLAVGASEASLFARVTPGAEEPEVQIQFINFSFTTMAEGLHRHPGIALVVGQCRPDSRGEIALASPDPEAPPRIVPNYLSAPNDLFVTVEAVKLARRIVAAQPLAGLIEAELLPGPAVADDAAIAAWVREAASTVYHPCGTVRMGEDDAAPLDPRLRVKGIAGLRVADASVFPLVPSSNIQPAVLMVAERAAAMIREDARG
ncbi:choline dehydrogenase [Elioraea sp. Yellowstone]|uniref:GMC family oxidoreductase n=1 Tax=Elioraea sp. Yellowstone TaxID=2592070 RepID=UPI00114E0A8E|nr:GMC family oxidoreductase N-terminal domain-containing protein [Elioraea sp. Yellowstone]TQF78177.1 choline dehydrogenase [Elioraea sp. Yellowstone]